jgi:ribonuclease BN (tRNA processing enzyme)
MADERFEVGPFQLGTWPLPHFVRNAGLRLTAGGRVLACTGETGPSPDVVALHKGPCTKGPAQRALHKGPCTGDDLFVAEATFPERTPAYATQYLSSAQRAGESAVKAGVGCLLLTHLWPGTARKAAEDAAQQAYSGEIAVARAGVIVDLA